MTTSAALSQPQRIVTQEDARPVSRDLHRDIERFLYREARLLDQQRLREWIDTMLDPSIRYQMVIRDERYIKDKTPEKDREIFVYDDDFRAMDLRVRQFETGLQRMLDPPQHMRRFVANVEAYYGAADGEFLVLSYGTSYRFRRGYESGEVVYQRTDKIRREGEAAFRIQARRIDLIERVVRSKNLLFFL